MSTKQPRITVLMATYNRSHLIDRFVDNLMKQTFTNFELVIVNNGSEDDTQEVLKKYENHERIRVLHLDKNRGCSGGYNFAFDQIRGEWFATLGDDDQIEEDAFEVMLKVVDEMDPGITAITANALDIATGEMSGFGLDKDQYLPIEVLVGKTSGEFFGITKTDLLGDLRLNEKLQGDEDTFWFQIDVKAKRYYIHRALKIWGTPNVATESERYRAHDLDMRTELYRELLAETHYWEILRKYNRKQFIARCLRGMYFQQIAGNKEGVQQYKNMLMQARPSLKHNLLSGFLSGIQPKVLNQLYQMIGKYKWIGASSRLFLKKYSRISQ